MTTERRLHSRKVPTEFTFIQIEQEFGGRVLNYSKEGLSFETSAPISDTDMVQFWLSFRRHGQVNGVGRIAWLNEKKNLGGIAFVHLSRASREKIDEWTGAVAEPESEGGSSARKEEESPEHVVSEIMDRVLAERRKAVAPAPALPVVSRSEGATDAAGPVRVPEPERQKTSKGGSSAVLTPPTPSAPDSLVANAAAVATPSESHPADARVSAATPALAPTTKERVDSAKVDEAATNGAREPHSSAGPSAPLPSALAPVMQEASDLWSTTGSGEPRPAPKSVAASALRAMSSRQFDDEAEQSNDAAAVLENALPEVLEAGTPPWLANAESLEQTDASANPDSSEDDDTTQLVPVKQYLYARRSQFLRGAAIGIGVSVVMTIAVLGFRKPARGTLAESTRNAVSANSTVAKENPAPVAAVGPSSGLTEESKGALASQTSPSKPPAVRPNPPATKEPSRASGSVPNVSATPDAVPTSEQGSADGSRNVIPRPSSFANRNSATGTGFQPLFEPSQAGNSDPQPGDAQPWNGQPKVEVGLGSTPWTFRRRNIHGNPPAGGDVHPPELIAQVAPRYPEFAKAQHISGDVVIDALIDTRGNVHKTQVVSGPMPLRGAAVSAVMMWKYKPAVLDGKPTEVHERITVRFVAQ
jgi:TonB family protein